MQFIKNIFFFVFLFRVTELFATSRMPQQPFDTLVKRFEIVLEGKLIYRTEPYYTKPTSRYPNSSYVSSYIVQVLKLFKGNVQYKYVELPWHETKRNSNVFSSDDMNPLLSVGSTAIFFLSTTYDTAFTHQFYNSGDTIAKHNIYKTTRNLLDYSVDYTYPPFNMFDIETKFYQHIEKLTGQKRKIISKPLLENIETINWLNETGKHNLKYEEGLSIYFSHFYVPWVTNLWDVYIKITNSLGATPLKTIQFGIKYNQKAFGSFVAKNNSVKINYKVGDASKCFYQPKLYESEISDIDSNSILITIKANDCSQNLLHIVDDIIGHIRFTIKDNKQNTDISFLPTYCKATYFDFVSNCEQSFSYIRCKGKVDIIPFETFSPQLYSFSPDTIRCGTNEVLTIKGKYLSSSNTFLVFNGKGGDVAIKSDGFLTQSDTIITLKIPCKIKQNYVIVNGSEVAITAGFSLNKHGAKDHKNTNHRLIIIQPK